ncbi:MAG: hypothetical protein HY321_03630 [Armatimonadetes bacterium]|nr:hypothetical protein [Armatimonadota bacterium]
MMTEKNPCPICGENRCDVPDEARDPLELAIWTVSRLFCQQPEVLRRQLHNPKDHWWTFITPVMALIRHAQAAATSDRNAGLAIQEVQKVA